jgi:hypothetical protein
VVNRKTEQKPKHTGQKQQSSGSLISWLVVAIVAMFFVYQLFDIAVASS